MPLPVYERATTHPERCRFCGSSEFWRIGLSLWKGMNTATGEHAYGTTATVRCCKCHATFSAELHKVDPSKIEWHLGHGV